MYYKECTVCGASLDPGERCDYCAEKQEKMKQIKKQIEKVIRIEESGQLKFNLS